MARLTMVEQTDASSVCLETLHGTERETDGRNDRANHDQDGQPTFRSWLNRCRSLAKVSMSTQAGQLARARQRLSDSHLSWQQQQSQQFDDT